MLKILLNYGIVTFPFLNLSKSLKNSSILTLFITTAAYSLDSTSLGSFAIFTGFKENLFSITFTSLVLPSKNGD